MTPQSPRPAAPEKPFGFVAVCAGEGLAGVFRDLGADGIIEGGQTMNPSTEDILHAIEQTPAEVVFVLPNNKNIIMAAQAAQELATREVVVVPTKTVPQGITAMLSFDETQSASENAELMTESLAGVTTMQITYAARNSDFEGRDIHEGEYLALYNGALLGNSRTSTRCFRQWQRKQPKRARNSSTSSTARIPRQSRRPTRRSCLQRRFRMRRSTSCPAVSRFTTTSSAE